MSFTDEQRAAIDKIEKLLNLAAKAGTPEEAASATAKAQELLVKYNLDTAALEDSTAKQSAKRERIMVEAGRYSFQRDLWRSVAELNFCHYWQRQIDKKKEHCLIGRTVNTKATIAMATYLESAIERMANKRVTAEGWMINSKWSLDYRKGAFEAVIKKIEKERDKAVEQENIDAMPGMQLTIVSHAKSEEAANYDFRFGEGASIKRDEIEAENARYWQEAEAAYTIWASANPNKAATHFEFEGPLGQHCFRWKISRYDQLDGNRRSRQEFDGA